MKIALSFCYCNEVTSPGEAKNALVMHFPVFVIENHFASAIDCLVRDSACLFI
jgi:hypothetical protein